VTYVTKSHIGLSQIYEVVTWN